MEYYSAIKKNTFESVLMRWMKLEPSHFVIPHLVSAYYLCKIAVDNITNDHHISKSNGHLPILFYFFYFKNFILECS